MYSGLFTIANTIVQHLTAQRHSRTKHLAKKENRIKRIFKDSISSLKITGSNVHDVKLKK